MNLNDWIQLNQIPASITPNGLCVVVREEYGNRVDLWGLFDYSVCGSSSMVVWLEPTVETEIPLYVLPSPTTERNRNRLTTGPRLPEQYSWVRTGRLAYSVRTNEPLFDENGLIMEDDEGSLLGPTQHMKTPDIMPNTVIHTHPLDGCFWVEKTEEWDRV